MNEWSKNLHVVGVTEDCFSLRSYLSFSCEGLSWLHGSSSSPQSLLTHRAVEGKKKKKKKHGTEKIRGLSLRKK